MVAVMRKAPHTGTVTIDVPGAGETRLRFDWESIAELHGTYGKEWEKKVEAIMSDLDARGLAEILAIGSEHDAGWWMEQSPPFIPTARAVQDAIQLAFFGAGELDKNPTLARRLMTQLERLGRSGSNSAGAPVSSGG